MNHNITHEKAFTAQNLVYIGFIALTLFTGLGMFSPILFPHSCVIDAKTVTCQAIDVEDLKVAWVGAVMSLITWLVAKAKYEGNNGTDANSQGNNVPQNG